MAITCDEVLEYDINNKSVNNLTYYNFIERIINKLKLKNNNISYIFVSDNAPIHKSPDVKKLIEKNNYKILFTPPYSLSKPLVLINDIDNETLSHYLCSPNLNPIENTFGIIKKIYKNELQLKNYNTTNIINDIEGSILIFEDIHKNNLKSPLFFLKKSRHGKKTIYFLKFIF